MKAKINDGGTLSIERAGKYIEQYCPFRTPYPDNTLPECGDWCPLFGDVEISEPVTTQQLSLCHGTLIKGEVVDERKKQ